jgi:CHAT domain-containing protein/Tfp pilus assembly protein PilF
MLTRLLTTWKKCSPQSGVFGRIGFSATLVLALWLVPFGSIFAATSQRGADLNAAGLRAAPLPQHLRVAWPEKRAAVTHAIQIATMKGSTTSPKDDKRSTAEKAFQQGQQLRAQGTAESLRRAIEKYQEAFQLWHAAGDGIWEGITLNNIGLVYYGLGEQQKALDYYNRAVPLIHAAGDRGAEAITLTNIGAVYGDRGENRKALDYYKQALSLSQAVGDRAQEAITLGGLAQVNADLGEKRKALDYDKQALSLIRAVGDRASEGRILSNIGLVYSDLGEKQKALDYYNQALPVLRALRDGKGEAATLSHIGLVYDDLGEKRKALDYYNQALPVSQAVWDRARQANILDGIGTVYMSLGEEQKALDYISQALTLSRAVGDRAGEASELNQIGGVYHDLGEWQKALDAFNQAVPLLRAVGDRAREARTLINIGTIYSHLNSDLSDQQKALDYYNQARLVLRGVGDRDGEGNILSHIGRLYSDLGEKRKALDYYNQALPVFRGVGDRATEAITLNGIGLVYGDLGEKQKALDYFNQALPVLRAVGNRATEAITLSNIALIERDRGHLLEARTQIEAALSIIGSLRTKIVSEELRASYFASVSRDYEFYVDLLMRLHHLHPSEKYDRLALEASEGGRARSLLELLNEAGAHIRQGIDPALLARDRNIQQRLNAQAELKRKMLSGGHTLQQAADQDQQLRSLGSEYEQVEAEIRQKSPRYAALQQPRPLSLKEMQSVLDPDTLLLEYALGQEHSYLWAVTPTTMSSYELPKRQEIEGEVRQVYNLLIARIRRWAEADREYEHAAASLSEMLLGPVASQLGGKRLVIVADGALNYIPFGALPVPIGRKTSSEAQAGFKPVVVEHEVINLPSASVLAVLRRETMGRKSAPRLVAVLADPVFSSNDERVRASSFTSSPTSKNTKGAESQQRTGSSPQLGEIELARSAQESGAARGGESLPRLKGTRQEADAILAFVAPQQSKKALDFAANLTTATSAELAQYRYVHFATHGLLDSQHPELSGVVLSLVDEHGERVDGFLRLHDIFNLNLPAELVVLSACETGLGKEIQGEGLVGLTRGFMYAGSPRVVVSLWNVGDVATAELMRRFYQGMLQGGLRPAAALRAAQVAMWNDATWHAPYFWAAFVLQGEWK